jgi:hypothetical protein
MHLDVRKEILMSVSNIAITLISGPAAVSGGRSSPCGGEGAPPSALASRRWGPTYTAVYAQYMEPWADFFDVLRLLI